MMPNNESQHSSRGTKKTTLCYIEQDGKYLMLYRNKKENDQSQGKWLGVGGKFETGETPDECLLREVSEETGLTLTKYRFRGLIKFSSDIWETEFMYLYTATGFSGVLKECDEGEFSWIDKSEVYDLPVWEGDKEIFRALETRDEFFTMEVHYEGDRLTECSPCLPSPLDKLYALQDKAYAAFQAKLIPEIPEDTVIGVRVPLLRKLAKEYIKSPDTEIFLNTLPHYFYDETLFHGILVSEIKDYDICLEKLNSLLPYVDNWAVCDIIAPKAFKKNKEKLFKEILEWSSSAHTYTCRFGLEMLMTHFLDEDFRPEYLDIPAGIHSEEYYLRMMIAWFFATALAKQWEASFPYIRDGLLDDRVHNKTIQKAVESNRIPTDRKELLKTYRRRGQHRR